jgi:hypothetical protein
MTEGPTKEPTYEAVAARVGNLRRYCRFRKSCRGPKLSLVRIFSGKFGGTNCGFTTFQQCLDTVSGIGGFCERNNLYQPPPGPHPLTRRYRPYPY